MEDLYHIQVATYIQAADLHMKFTHPVLIQEFDLDEEHFFEVFDRAYEKVVTQARTPQESRVLSNEPNEQLNSGLRSKIGHNLWD